MLTRFPLGLLQAWSCGIRAGLPGLSSTPGPAPLPAAAASSSGGGLGEQGWAARITRDSAPYVPGDSPRRIAWKAATRTDQWLVKRFTDQARPELWLDWRLLGIDNVEPRLEQLCQWVLKAEGDGRQYGLRLPGVQISPAWGDDQRRRCLEALALF
ncbi:MAG: DUF58 domain-containing protein [Candidatus Competibacteraceae bacterium]